MKRLMDEIQKTRNIVKRADSTNQAPELKGTKTEYPDATKPNPNLANINSFLVDPLFVTKRDKDNKPSVVWQRRQDIPSYMPDGKGVTWRRPHWDKKDWHYGTVENVEKQNQGRALVSDLLQNGAYINSGTPNIPSGVHVDRYGHVYDENNKVIAITDNGKVTPLKNFDGRNYSWSRIKPVDNPEYFGLDPNKTYYQPNTDPEDGMIIWDANHQPVMALTGNQWNDWKSQRANPPRVTPPPNVAPIQQQQNPTGVIPDTTANYDPRKDIQENGGNIDPDLAFHYGIEGPGMIRSDDENGDYVESMDGERIVRTPLPGGNPFMFPALPENEAAEELGNPENDDPWPELQRQRDAASLQSQLAEAQRTEPTANQFIDDANYNIPKIVTRTMQENLGLPEEAIGYPYFNDPEGLRIVDYNGQDYRVFPNTPEPTPEALIPDGAGHQGLEPEKEPDFTPSAWNQDPMSPDGMTPTGPGHQGPDFRDPDAISDVQDNGWKAYVPELGGLGDVEQAHPEEVFSTPYPMNEGALITPDEDMRKRFNIPEGNLVLRNPVNESLQIYDPVTRTASPLDTRIPTKIENTPEAPVDGGQGTTKTTAPSAPLPAVLGWRQGGILPAFGIKPIFGDNDPGAREEDFFPSWLRGLSNAPGATSVGTSSDGILDSVDTPETTPEPEDPYFTKYKELIQAVNKDADVASDVGWEIDKRTGDPMLRYTDSKGDEHIVHPSSLPLEKIRNVIGDTPFGLMPIDRSSLLMGTSKANSYPFVTKDEDYVWNFTPQRGLSRPLGNIEVKGKRQPVFLTGTGDVVDEAGNRVDTSTLLGGTEFAQGKYRIHGIERGVPLGLRSMKTPTGTMFYDPTTGKRVPAEKLDELYPDYVQTTDVRPTPQFALPAGHKFSTGRFKFVENETKEGEEPTYRVEIVNPDGTTTPDKKHTKLSLEEAEAFQANPHTDTLYPIRNGSATHVTIDPTDPEHPRLVLHDSKGRSLSYDWNSPEAEEILGSLEPGEPTYTNGPEGPMTWTIGPEGITGTPFEMGPYSGRDSSEVVPPTGPVTFPLPSTESMPVKATTETTAPKPEEEDPTEEEEPTEEETTEEEKEKIFNEKVMKYIGYGIPIGLAVSLALWAVGGAKPENMLGTLAGGAGAGALLGGLGGRYGWYDNLFSGEEETTDSGDGDTPEGSGVAE